jgi:hypothetical protein
VADLRARHRVEVDEFPRMEGGPVSSPPVIERGVPLLLAGAGLGVEVDEQAVA